jgi:catechol 2,3-dioxygenase-like lactoylglutathione lyase family enzyme
MATRKKTSRVKKAGAAASSKAARSGRGAIAKKAPARAARAAAAKKKAPAPARKATPAQAKKQRPAAKAAARSAGSRVAERRKQPEALRLRESSVSLTVNDLARSLRFYTDALGFTVKERWERDGVLRGVQLVAGASELGLTQDDWAKGRDRVKGVGMRVWAGTTQDLDALARRIRDKGGEAEGPKAESWGTQTVSVADPDGFRITFYRLD